MLSKYLLIWSMCVCCARFGSTYTKIDPCVCELASHRVPWFLARMNFTIGFLVSPGVWGASKAVARAIADHSSLHMSPVPVHPKSTAPWVRPITKSVQGFSESLRLHEHTNVLPRISFPRFYKERWLRWMKKVQRQWQEPYQKSLLITCLPSSEWTGHFSSLSMKKPPEPCYFWAGWWIRLSCDLQHVWVFGSTAMLHPRCLNPQGHWHWASPLVLKVLV